MNKNTRHKQITQENDRNTKENKGGWSKPKQIEKNERKRMQTQENLDLGDTHFTKPENCEKEGFPFL